MAFTVKTKLVLADNPPPSLTVKVMVAVPLFPLTGVIVTVRAAPEPPMTILAVGAKVVLLDATVNVNEATGVRSSPSVKANADVAEFMLII